MGDLSLRSTRSLPPRPWSRCTHAIGRSGPQLTKQVPAELFDAQSLITPSCGIRFADVAGANAIHHAAAEISRRIRAEEKIPYTPPI